MIIPVLHSGLGNQLFQFSFTYAAAKRLGVPFGINPQMIIKSSHTNFDYSQTIYKTAIEKYAAQYTPELSLQMRPEDEVMEELVPMCKEFLKTVSVLGMGAYAQWEPIFRGYRNEIFALLNWGDAHAVAAARYDTKNTFFIHFRRGDFVGTTFWKDLTLYHHRVIDRVLKYRPDAKFMIISDDIEYCRTNIEYLRDIPCVFVEGLDELETMCLMSQCELGGACANSTFSWWGLYLNYNRPLMFIPDYFEKSKYGFPGSETIASQ